jgi:glycerophosphoryl diester phosphodiesterase
MLRRPRRILTLVWVLLLARNTSALTPSPYGQPLLIAHRGVHQLYSRDDLTKNTCTATRIFPPLHDFIEATLPSIEAAFDAGADVVEIDVQPTRDGHWVVFHDWTLDCRTNGHGLTREQSLSELQTLDVGYGYSADGGRTYPFRGKGLGMMPSLDNVLDAFPGRHFLINFKSASADEGERFAQWLTHQPRRQAQIWAVYGHEAPVNAAVAGVPALASITKSAIKSCFLPYFAYGWTGIIPEACRGQRLFLPENYRRFAWGWPDRFLSRMQSVDATVILRGPTDDTAGGGINTREQLAHVPDLFPGVIWTDDILTIAPLIKHR